MGSAMAPTSPARRSVAAGSGWRLEPAGSRCVPAPTLAGYLGSPTRSPGFSTWRRPAGPGVLNASLTTTSEAGRTFLTPLIDDMVDAGIVVVGATGNGAGRPGLPAAHPRVIAVGATTPSGEMWGKQPVRPDRHRRDQAGDRRAGNRHHFDHSGRRIRSAPGGRAWRALRLLASWR